MSKRQRLFFALWPDEGLREAIAPLLNATQECGGRAHPPSNLHMTLSFLGGVDAETRDCVEQATGDIVAPPFSLTLDHFGYWPRPKVMWLGVSDTPESLSVLVNELNRVIEGCGLQIEERTYRPHMTLLRKARQAPSLPAPSLNWQVREFVLAQSVSTPAGVEYRVIRRWPLKG